MCTADGVLINFPDQLPLHMMTLVEQTDTTLIRQPMAYWLRLTPEQSMLQHQWEPWSNQIKSNVALNCTLNFDEKQSQEDYEMCWDEQNRKAFPLITEDIYLGPQGVAAAVTLPPKLKHITLTIGKGH